jgi:alpha-mannosidase
MRFIYFSCALLTAGCVMAQRSSPPPRPASQYEKVLTRLAETTSVPITQWRFHAAGLSHGEDPSLDDSGWTAVLLTTGRNGRTPAASGTGWYRASFEVPAKVGGKEIRGARLKLAVRLSNDGRVFLNGGLAAQGEGRTLDPIFITDRAAPGQKLLVAVKTPYHADDGRLLGATLMIEYPDETDPGLLRTEIEATENVVRAISEGRAERQQRLDEAVSAIDLSALDRGDQQAFDRSLKTAHQALKPLQDWIKQYSIRAMGTSHIDMAWEWPWTETVEVVRDTFTSALQLLSEYPKMTYVQSTARQFAWMEEKYPRLFQQIQQRVKEGRWQIVGGMWVEPDLVMPDGESLVRQLLMGKRYFQQKFGVDVKIGWNPDSFGYNWQLPQIYKKAGVDSFVTQKLSWNETTTFPYRLFWWQSPDGSRVLTYFPHTYNNNMEPARMSQDVEDYVPQTSFPEVMYIYGVGDHGGGPTRQMLDQEARLQLPRTVFPAVIDSTPADFFADIRKDMEKGSLHPKVWNDELYLEYHRGCFTSQSETKKWIRHGEELMQNAEKFAALSFLSGHAYPHREFQSSWEKVLFNQFHDIMPGSGINAIYDDAIDDLKTADNQGQKILGTALTDLAARIDTRGDGMAVVVYNPLSWERTEAVMIEAPRPAGGERYEARNEAGELLPSQVISEDEAANQVKLEVLVKGVPSLGYATIHLVPTARPRPVMSRLKVNGMTIENEFLTMKLDARTGCIISLVNREAGKESVAPGGCGNLVQAFKDLPRVQDAWEIKFDEDHWDLKQPEEVRLIESGPVRAVVRIKHKFQSSSLVQDVTVYAGVPRVDVETRVDWHEQHILLKAGFPATVDTSKATFETPYGTTERPTTRNTPEERAKFEVPALRWGDLSDATHGVTLLNASKYGYDAKDNVIRLSLLRSPLTPRLNEPTDQGLHEFTYALYAHGGDWRQGGSMQQGYELNFPLLTLATAAHRGPLPAKHSFVRIEPANVILTVLKKAEDEDALVFRFYEFQGKAAQVRLSLPAAAEAAAESNLMEKNEKPLALAAGGREVTVQTGPYEIKTIAVKFGTATGKQRAAAASRSGIE